MSNKKPEYEVYFKQRFTLKPQEVTRLAKDISSLTDIPIPSQLDGQNIDQVRIDVSVDDSGKPPFNYTLKYQNRFFKEDSYVAFRGYHMRNGKLVPSDLFSSDPARTVLT